MQKALRKAGFNPGPDDNIFGPRTYAAMVAFQKANNMWQGHLDYETAAALGLTLLPEAFQNMDGTTTSMPDNMGSNERNEENEEVLTGRGDGNSNSSDNSTTTGSGGNESGATSNNETAATTPPSTPNTNASMSTMSSMEQQMIDEINLLRKDPKGYVKHVEEYIKQVQNDDMLDAAYKAEEISTAKELINELKNLNPLSILEPHQGLHRVLCGFCFQFTSSR